MTREELLQAIVEASDEELAVVERALVRHEHPASPGPGRGVPGTGERPRFIGMGRSGLGDLAENSDKYLAEGFGR